MKSTIQKSKGKFLLLSAGCILLMALSSNAHWRGHRHSDNRRCTDSIVTAHPELGAFSKISLTLPANLEINVSDAQAPGTTISGCDKAMKHVKTRVKDGELEIYSDLNVGWETSKYDCLSVTITMPRLALLYLESSVNANVHGVLAGDDMRLVVSGSANVKVDSVALDHMDFEVLGSANVDVKKGYARSATYNVSGAGRLHCYGFQTSETAAHISGSANCELTASKNLELNISGSAKVSYKGHPTLNQSISGSVKINDAN